MPSSFPVPTLRLQSDRFRALKHPSVQARGLAVRGPRGSRPRQGGLASQIPNGYDTRPGITLRPVNQLTGNALFIPGSNTPQTVQPLSGPQTPIGEGPRSRCPRTPTFIQTYRQIRHLSFFRLSTFHHREHCRLGHTGTQSQHLCTVYMGKWLFPAHCPTRGINSSLLGLIVFRLSCLAMV